MNTKIQLGTGGWGFRELPLERQLQITRELGLATLEFGLAESVPVAALPLTADEAALENVRAQYRAAGVPLTHIYTGNDFTLPDAEKSRAGIERMQRIIGLAARLGATYLRIFAGFSPVAEVTGRRWDVMLECLERCAVAARAAGIVLALETHGGVQAAEGGVIHFHSVSTEPASLLRLCREMPADIVLNFDPANLRAAGVVSPHELVPQIASRVRYLHLKDFAPVDPARNIVRPVACGEGLLDWPALLASLSFYEGVALIEYEPTADIAEGTKRSLEFLRAHL